MGVVLCLKCVSADEIDTCVKQYKSQAGKQGK